MRVDGVNPWSGIEALNSPASEKAKAENAIESSDDETQLSSDATFASDLNQRLNDVPEVRQAKVDRLREAVQSGTYGATSEQIAGAMFDDLKFLTRRS